jgi:hypothetical protein
MLKALAKQTHNQNCVCELARVKTKNNANDTKQFEKTHTHKQYNKSTDETKRSKT